jgi:CHASE1-domain containing sensor protein
MKVPKWLNSWPSTAGKGLFFRQGGYFAFARRLLRRPKPGQDHGPMAAVIAFIFGFAVSISAFFTVQSLYRADALKGFEGPAAQFTVAVSQSLERYLEILNAVGAFFAASNEVDRWEFFEFARETLPRYQGVTALTWVPRVLDEEREAFEHRARDDGLFGFRFKDLGGGAEQTTAAARDVHYPVFYVEPDLAILHEARDSGSVRIARLDSQDAGARAPNLVIVLPVYRLGKVPETLDDRKGELLGFARAHIALPELVAAALPGPTAPPGLDIYIYDDSAEPGRRLVTYYPSPGSGAPW